jgi:DNA-binding IclR family transcriptional regulator
MDDWSRWRLVLSAPAVSLWRFLSEQSEQATATLSELARDLHTSKTGVRKALAELEGHGFIAMVEEDGTWRDLA